MFKFCRSLGFCQTIIAAAEICGAIFDGAKERALVI